ncbi:F-box protein At3g07870-like [Cynara cardunculus var. scolymus]|uniref:F-box associated domain, type 1 n=1 Tax=Cynara cardunculus var. scolymus TaxID=59895 RepID=A0A118K190_CYNCS|nr:F-box protein At3g07870-like [Cynara cardunculus var. scolymus]KVI02071.1 F-box associated domain, type 1 [Cynara cardunculus var. scolymus]
MEELPPDVMADVLSRLPVKTIIHCKLVCKKWQNLVLDSYFVNLHLSKSPPSLVIHHNSEKDLIGYYKPGILKWVEIEDELDHHHLHHDPVTSLDLNLAPSFQKTQILPVGSVNGLICLWQFGPEGDNTYICNPITREYMILPRQRYYREGYAIIVYGFGVSLMTGEYKVIRTFQGDIPPDPYVSSRPSLLEAEVYTLGTNQWRSLGHVPYWLNGFHGPFLNGHFHWIVCEKDDASEKLCTFDLDKETFQLFPSPPIESIEESQIHFQSLAVLKGCLCQSDTYDSEFTIWVMKEYGIKKSWHKEVVIKQAISPDLDWLMWEPMYLIEGLKDGRILMMYCEDKLLSYCPKSKTVENTEIFDRYLSGMAYRPSFLKLENFESERVHVL